MKLHKIKSHAHMLGFDTHKRHTTPSGEKRSPSHKRTNGLKRLRRALKKRERREAQHHMVADMAAAQQIREDEQLAAWFPLFDAQAYEDYVHGYDYDAEMSRDIYDDYDDFSYRMWHADVHGDRLIDIGDEHTQLCPHCYGKIRND